MQYLDMPHYRRPLPQVSKGAHPFYKEEGTFTEWAIRFDKTSKPRHWTTPALCLSDRDSGNPRALLLSPGASRATASSAHL